MLEMPDMKEKHKVSPFLNPGTQTTPNSLAIVQLSRDNFLPVYLQEPKGEVDGYAEGAVINTRFGSFPHSTLLNVPWGSQVRASAVDTGSRGRKRKRNPAEDSTNGEPEDNKVKEAVTANSGFVHVLNPTPELWTSSLPHRTQVVYTPDYSYILHRIGARPGSVLIEAGSGSGSFSHASARAVYNGYPKDEHDRRGKVCSFEFNEDRYNKMRKEIADHNLTTLIHLWHRDVYTGGFLADGKSPGADCIFLDLPAPWEAIPHLSRQRPDSLTTIIADDDDNEEEAKPWISPLNPNRSAHLCTFSPCIEQVTRTIEALRKNGWVEIDMVELSHKKINVIRERVGLSAAQEKGSSHAPRDVKEAVARLKEVNAKARDFHGCRKDVEDMDLDLDLDEEEDGDNITETKTNWDTNETATTTTTTTATPLWLQGRLVHRTESEIKTHTSYLTFAVLPQEWTEEREQAALATWPVGGETTKIIGSLGREARKQEKRQLLQGKKKNKTIKGKKEERVQ